MDKIEGKTVMYHKMGVFLFFIFVFAGCAHSVDMRQLPPGSEDFLPSEVGLRIPAIIKSANLWVNGQEITPNSRFYNLVLQKLQSTHVFLQVAFQENSRNMLMREKAVSLELTANGVIDTNQTSNQVKLIANLATLFIFSSALPFKDEFDVTMALKAIRYDGKEKYYKSRIKGSISYLLFAGEKARQDAQEQVVNKLLNSIMRQVIQDIPFFSMERQSFLHLHPAGANFNQADLFYKPLTSKTVS